MPLGKANIAKIKLKQDPEGNLYVDGFPGGLNTLVSPQHIQDNECSALLNAQITEDGVITRRAGSTAYDSALNGTRVFGLGMFTTFDANGNPVRTLLKMDNAGNLKKFSAGSWSTITGYTYQTGLNTEFVQSQTAAYIFNGKDPLSRTDGSTITTFTAVTDPVGGLTVAQTGAAGTSSYSYTYTLVTQYGETNPVANVTIANGNATLNTTNYNLLTITRSSNALVTGYNVYGRSGGASGNNFFMKFIPQTASGNPTYQDTNADTPNVAVAAPTSNTTVGKIGSIPLVYHATLLIAGDPAFPSRVWYSAGTTKFEDFQLVNSAGFIDVNPQDGDKITALVSFKDKVVVLKNRSSYIFAFDSSGNPSLTLVNPLIGCSAPRSAKVVLNDVFFLSPTGAVFTLGYQQGYYGAGGVADLLRTNEVSIKIKPTLASINNANIKYATAIYSVPNYKYVLAYADGANTYNNKMVVCDTRYNNAWAQWDNMNINCLLSFIDANNNEIVLYGDDNAGRVVQMFSGTSDQGSAFTFRMQSKDFNANAFHILKTWVWPTVRFRQVSGTIKITLLTDGVNTQYSNSITITSSNLYSGWSFDRWAKFKWGTTSATTSAATASDAPRQINQRFDSRSLMYLFENTSTSDTLNILSLQSRYIRRIGRRLDSTLVIN